MLRLLFPVLPAHPLVAGLQHDAPGEAHGAASGDVRREQQGAGGAHATDARGRHADRSADAFGNAHGHAVGLEAASGRLLHPLVVRHLGGGLDAELVEEVQCVVLAVAADQPVCAVLADDADGSLRDLLQAEGPAEAQIVDVAAARLEVGEDAEPQEEVSRRACHQELQDHVHAIRGHVADRERSLPSTCPQEVAVHAHAGAVRPEGRLQDDGPVPAGAPEEGVPTELFPERRGQALQDPGGLTDVAVRRVL
mmetsp:Transcript_12299/g.24986  ORF Transcript_12299/g.24986 Transcript_12299/m.24986 type:complete len:252 (+) Transcript_12299:195-950(+)